ncbi:hypothetical protein ASF34_12535 [Methylobacterium sp. Leaf106]|nr:hypothetical protein ASF34_12535 [Methylobacterium sp. Leaf106]
MSAAVRHLIPSTDLILRCRASGLEGGFQAPLRELEGSFEASAPLRHLRMRWADGGRPVSQFAYYASDRVRP